MYFQALCSRFCMSASTRGGSAMALSPGATSQRTWRCGSVLENSSSKRVAMVLRLTGLRCRSPRENCESVRRPSMSSPIFLLAPMMRSRWDRLSPAHSGLSSRSACAKPLMMRSGDRKSCATA
ncbi:hypothetical protein D9M69_561610 [compost metagenome]